MEWSWKLRLRESLGNRVFWLGAPDCREETAAHLRWLASEIDLTPSGFDGGQEEWRDLAARHTERALVAYAGSYDGRPSAIKVYLTVDDPEVCREAVFGSTASKGLPVPPRTTGFEVYSGGRVEGRQPVRELGTGR